MSRFLKTYEEWNPFLSKDEKAKRAEEAKKKEEEELARKKEEEKQAKKEESFKNLKEASGEVESYKNSSIIDLEKSKYSKDDFITYSVRMKDNFLNDLKVKAEYECSINLSSSISFGNSISFNLELKIDKNDIDIPEDIVRKIDKSLSSQRIDNRFYTTYKYYIFKIRVSSNIGGSGVKSFLDKIFNKWSPNSISNYLIDLNSILDLVDQEKERNKKQEKFKEKANEILDCFYDVIDLCDSHDVAYIEAENCYKFLFNIGSIKTDPFNIQLRMPYGQSYGGSKNLTVNKASFYLDDKMLDFFYYLSEAKPRVNDLVPNCEFKVEMTNGQILLTIK